MNTGAMPKTLFLICADLSAEMVSNGKSSLLRLGAELVRQGCEVQILFCINQTPNIINPFTKLFSKTFDEFLSLNPNVPLDKLYPRFQRIRYAQSRLATYGLRAVSDLTEVKKRAHVVIYPETFSTNPLNSENVVRYYGFKPGILNYYEPETAKYNNDEFTLAASRNIMHAPDFTLFDPHIDELFIRKNITNWDDRDLSLVYKGKNKSATISPLDHSFIEISRDWPDRFTLAELLHKSKYFFTWDSYSILNIEATLAGAVPIFCDNWYMTDAELDAGELGIIPRRKIDDFVNDNIDIDSFEVERRNLIHRLILLQENWPTEVAKFLDAVTQKFSL